MRLVLRQKKNSELAVFTTSRWGPFPAGGGVFAADIPSFIMRQRYAARHSKRGHDDYKCTSGNIVIAFHDYCAFQRWGLPIIPAECDL